MALLLPVQRVPVWLEQVWLALVFVTVQLWHVPVCLWLVPLPV
jgi:hypothetical protein